MGSSVLVTLLKLIHPADGVRDEFSLSALFKVQTVVGKKTLGETVTGAITINKGVSYLLILLAVDLCLIP